MSDWETRSFKYVLSAIDSAQKRQQKLWDAIMATRGKDGLVPVKWPAMEEYVESCRRTHSLMIDLETVASEYEARIGGKAKAPAAKAAAKAPAARAKQGKGAKAAAMARRAK